MVFGSRNISRLPFFLCLAWFLLGIATPYGLTQNLTFRFDRLTAEDGLPHPSVLDIMQDDLGFMWFATVSGIVRYDGREMVTYYPSAVHPDSMPPRELPRLFQTKSGDIWLGLNQQKAKLFKYDPGIDQFVPYLFDPAREDQIIRAPVAAVTEDRNGNLIVTTDGQGLFVIDIRKEQENFDPADLPYRHFQESEGHPDSLASNYIGNAIVEDEDGHFWLPTDGGICLFLPEENRFKAFPISDGKEGSSNGCMTLFSDRPGRLWVGTWNQGLIEFDMKAKKEVHRFRHDPDDPFSLATDFIWRIAKDREGRLWIAGENHLDIFDPVTRRFQHVSKTEEKTYFGYVPLNIIFRDHSGNMWVGAWQEGIFRYNSDKGKFRVLRHRYFQHQNKDNDFVWPLLEDRGGQFWLCFQIEGLTRWDSRKNTLSHFRKGKDPLTSLVDDEIYNMVEGRKDYLWIGTPTALSRLHLPSGTFRHFYEYPKAELWKTRKGTIWFTLPRKGLCRLLDEKSGTTLCYPNEKTPMPEGVGTIVSLAEDEQEMLWLGFNQGGLIRFDPASETFELISRRYGVLDIHIDPSGKIWLSTHSSGIKIVDAQQKKLRGLPAGEAEKTGLTRDFLEDDQGLLWALNSRGMIQLDPVSESIVRTLKGSYWLDSREKWHFNATAAMKSRSGDFLIGSTNGLLLFHPDSTQMDRTPPKVALTAIRLYDRPLKPGPDSILTQHIAYTKSIDLKHFQNDLTLEFAALHFKSLQDNLYRYQLENYDRGWREGGDQPVATYTNLPPGAYHFNVRAANCDNVWSDPARLLTIRIRPPWYANPVAYAVYLAVLTGLLYLLYRDQLRRRLARAEIQRQQEINRFKSRFYANITHEFRTPLTLILGKAENLAGQTKENLRESENLIRDQGRQLLGLINQLLTLSKTESEKMPLKPVKADIIPFLKGITAGFDSATRQKGISLEVYTSRDSLIMDFDPDRLQMVLSNLLSNALKFTPSGGKVSLEVQATTGPENTLKITVSDTGSGIPREALPFIFDRYYQVEHADVAMERPGVTATGTGLGLALVKELVNQMEGRIRVDSTPGQGTTFRLELPARRSAAPAKVPVTESPIMPEPASLLKDIYQSRPLFASPATIDLPLLLIVEDHPDMVAFLAEILQDYYRVRTAPDGIRGLQKAIKEVPDIILSDVMMPQMDGLAFCRRLKEDLRTSHIPIILLTARAAHEHRLEGLEQGADDYLTKPFDRQELLVRLANLIASRQALRQRYENLAGLNLSDATPYPREDQFMKQVRDVIFNHLDDPDFQVTELCRALAMSRTQVHNKLKALTGHSTGHFIRKVRLHQAQALLISTALTVTEIAYQVGFRNANYFSTCFKEAFGQSPSEVRN